jgi:hypothetical protein
MKTNNWESIRTAVCLILTVSAFLFASCQDPSTPNVPAITTGSINGYAYYGSGDNHAGITVMLEQTDGLRSLSVISAARSIDQSVRSISAPTVAASTRTAADGSYTFPSVSPGTYTIYAYSPDSQEKAVAINNITVRAGESFIADTLILTPVGSVTGQITVDGAVYGNLGFLVCVAGTSYMAVTANDGTFTINDIPAGNGYFFAIIKGNFIAMWDTVPQTVNARETTTLSPNPRLISGDTINVTGGIVWQGERTSHPDNPQLNWAYYNSTEKMSFIWDGSAWQVLAKDGLNGISFVWKGELATAPANPQLNWAYYNSTEKKSFIWDGSAWQVLAQDGLNGISFVWKGELPTAPTNPQLNWAYYNIFDRISYIWDGAGWKVLTRDGADGISILWQGELASHPSDPQLNWAYYNSTDKKAYIWDGSVWWILAQDGRDGDSIIWQGEHYSAPTGAQVNWVYYNKTTGNAYIYDGTSWQIFASGAGITWKGERTSHPANPELNWAYYNSEDGISYIWDGYEWQILAKDGEGIGALTGIEIQYLGTLLIGELPDITKFWVRNVHEGGRKRDTSNYTYTVSGDSWTRGGYMSVIVTSVEDPAHSASVSIGVSGTLVDTGLPVLYIDTQNAVPIVSKEDWVNMTVKVVSDNPEYSFEKTAGNDEIRGRGNTSWTWPKKPYRMRFRQNTSMFGLTAARDWVLLSNYSVSTLMADTLAYELGQRFDGPLFPNHYVYVDVVLNGNYRGTYILTEHMRVAPGRVEIDPLNDYLVEIDAYYDEDPKFTTTNLGLPVMIKSPDYGPNIGDPHYQFVMDSINEFATVIRTGYNFPNNNWKDLIDIDSFVDFVMINDVARNIDMGRPLNILMYKVVGEKIKMSHLWDFDAGFGMRETGVPPNYNGPPSGIDFSTATKSMNEAGDMYGYGFFNRFFMAPEFVNRYKTRWNEKINEIQTIFTFIDETAAKIKVSHELNNRRWFAGVVDFDDQVDKLKTWLEMRVAFLDTEINDR